MLSLSGLPVNLISRFKDRAKILSWARRTAVRPVVPEPKKFTPKCPGLEVLESYEGTFPPSFWDRFPKYRPVSWDPKSWISGQGLLDRAREARVDNLTDALRAADILDNGANTGVEGAGRLPTAGRNQKSAYEHGGLLSDALGAWVQQGLMAGPYTREELPWNNVKISPMSIQLKPNGGESVIENLTSYWNFQRGG